MNIVASIAARRTALHADRSALSRSFSGDFDEVGLAGEVAFGSFSGVCPDFTDKPSGDGGYDFTIPLLYRVDVKTTKPGMNLIHRKDKPLSADIYVLAEVDGQNTTLVGWCWRRTLADADVRLLKKDGFPTFFLPREQLRPMSELSDRLWRLPG